MAGITEQKGSTEIPDQRRDIVKLNPTSRGNIKVVGLISRLKKRRGSNSKAKTLSEPSVLNLLLDLSTHTVNDESTR